MSAVEVPFWAWKVTNAQPCFCACRCSASMMRRSRAALARLTTRRDIRCGRERRALSSAPCMTRPSSSKSSRNAGPCPVGSDTNSGRLGSRKLCTNTRSGTVRQVGWMSRSSISTTAVRPEPIRPETNKL